VRDLLDVPAARLRSDHPRRLPAESAGDFCLDRAGLSPNDGPTHHGLFDLAFLRCVPNATIMQPKDEDELVDMLHTSLQLPARPSSATRAARAVGVPIKAAARLLPIGQAEVLREGSNIMIWALGPMVRMR
jgi:1-deoxy-D-xylulose-5-phosphate synthase